MTDFADRWGFGPDRFWLSGERPPDLVAFDEELGLWHVYGYPEALAVLDDSATFTTDTARLFGLDDETAKYVDGDLALMDGPEHLHLRGQVATAFTSDAVADLESRVRKTAGELLDGLAGRDRFDLLGEFVTDLSGIVFTELLGIPSADRALFGLVDQNMDADAQLTTADVDGGGDDYFESLTTPLQPLRDMLGGHVDERLRRPTDDLLGLLTRVSRLDGTRLTRDQVINFVIGILGAGHLSTPLLMGNTMLCLESFPEQARRVRADRSLVPSMLEETMRFLTPAAASYRATNTEVELAGRRIPKDTLLRLWFGPANRDPRRFTDPDVYDVSRHPNPHLGFGHGDHYCLGRRMIRVETRVVVDLLLDRYPNLRVDPDVPPVYYGSPDFTGVRSVSVLTR